MRKSTYKGYSIERLMFSDELIAFIDVYANSKDSGRHLKRGTFSEISQDIHDDVAEAGFQRAASTILTDLINNSCPAGLADIYLKRFKLYGFNPTDKPFFTKAEIVTIEKPMPEPVIQEKIVEKEKIVERTVTAKGDDWDSLALFKLIGQLSDSHFLYLQMLCGAVKMFGNNSPDWFYEQEKKKYLKQGKITEDDVRR